MADGQDRNDTIEDGHNPVREGIIAGLLSATVIVVWLGLVDMIGAHPFFTPTVLGRGLYSVFGGLRPTDTPGMYIALYTVFHYIAFCVIGIIVATIVHGARRSPGVMAGFLVVFVIFEMGFYGLAAALSVDSQLAGLAWYQIGAANLIAAAVMFYYMWARHPELKGNIRSALEGTDA